MTCLLSCSVCAFTPPTFTACERRSGETISLRHPHQTGPTQRARPFLALRPRAHLVSYVDLGEAEGLQVNAGGPDGRSDGFHQQLLQILADERPGLLDDLQEKSHFCTSEMAFGEYLQKEITGLTPKTDSFLLYSQSSWLKQKTNKQKKNQMTFKKLLI